MNRYNKFIITLFIILLFTLPLFVLISVRSDKILQVAGFYESPFNSNAIFPIENAVDEYNFMYPEIKTELHKEVTINEYNEWLSVKILKGDEPDVFLMTSQLYSELYDKGILKELSTELERLSNDKRIDAEFVKRAGYGSKIYAIPVAVDFSLMAVNKKILSKYGFSEIPDNWTWSDYQRMCRALGGENMRYGFSWEDGVYSNGGEIVDYLGKEDYLNSLEFVNAVNFVYRLNEGISKKATLRDFKEEKAAFYKLSGVDCINANLMQENIDFLPMPSGPQGGNISKVECIYICIGRNSVNKYKALKFVEIMLSDKIQSEIINSGYAMPIRALPEELILDDAAKKLCVLEKKILPLAYIVHRFKDDKYIFDIIHKRIEDAIEGGVKLDNALSELHIEISEFLDKPLY